MMNLCTDRAGFNRNPPRFRATYNFGDREITVWNPVYSQVGSIRFSELERILQIHAHRRAYNWMMAWLGCTVIKEGLGIAPRSAWTVRPSDHARSK